MTNAGRIMTGLAIGTVIGATIGMLFAPKKGKKTRAMIAGKAKEMGHTLGEGYEKAKELLPFTKKQNKEVSVN